MCSCVYQIMSTPSISIIIPVLNEEKILRESAGYYQALKEKARVIFVDGGSSDATVTIARDYGEVLASSPGRGIQKNCGAAAAPASDLLFLHVDAFLSDGALDHIAKAFAQGAAYGCLTMQIDDEGWMFRIYEQAVNVRARFLGVIDGDLGLFIRRRIFDELGGFRALSVMEDIDFARRLRAAQSIRVLPDPIRVSSRKWHERGFIRTFGDYSAAYVKLWSGRL
jgi:rSAM/selenodomain-associated transferase 2